MTAGGTLAYVLSVCVTLLQHHCTEAAPFSKSVYTHADTGAHGGVVVKTDLKPLPTSAVHPLKSELQTDLSTESSSNGTTCRYCSECPNLVCGLYSLHCGNTLMLGVIAYSMSFLMCLDGEQ